MKLPHEGLRVVQRQEVVLHLGNEARLHDHYYVQRKLRVPGPAQWEDAHAGALTKAQAMKFVQLLCGESETVVFEAYPGPSGVIEVKAAK